MQGRHGCIDPPVLDQGPHVTVEEGQQQDADVCAVNIGVGHHDDLVVACLVDVEAGSRASTDHLDNGGALLVGQHLGQGCLLHVEDFAADGQQCLEHGVSGGLGRTQSGVALDDEQLSNVVVARHGIRELGGHGS